MAKPRVFISSTFYDLKHVRSTLEQFVESLGYESILSEKGNIAYDPAMPLDESCYRDVRSSDIFVILIGGRYGSATSNEARKVPANFFERYCSITRKEYESAIERDIPTYILVERAVFTEYETFRKNRDEQDIVYAHVDSVNVFLLIDQILSQPRNNPLHQFDKQVEVTAWLREQWSGLFKELLVTRSERRQLSSLSDQVKGLKDINTTLKTYLEAIISRVSERTEAKELIESEDKRLAESRKMNEFSQHPWIKQLVEHEKLLDLDAARKIFTEAHSLEEVAEAVGKLVPDRYSVDMILSAWREKTEGGQLYGERYVNEIRKILGFPPISFKTKPKK